jgi:DNA invertase Pin-like site-specific DNA recombinase
MSRLIGYARVSTQEQDLALQIDALEKAGCSRIFEDKATGAKSIRRGLEDCVAALTPGDTLIVWRLDRLGRSLQHLVSLVSELKEKGISLKSLQDGAIDTTTANGELIFNIFAAFAQFERELIRERTHAGLASARARGKKGGRKPISASDSKVKLARLMHADPNHSVKDICSTLSISRATYYRYIQQ